MVIRAVGCAVLCTATIAVRATNADNPYQGIVVRNVFALKSPPPPPSTEPPKPAPPKITLNGITDLFGYSQALLTVQTPAKPGEPAKPQSLILKEGEREGEVEVVQIDMAAGSVKVNNYGTPMTLTFEKDGAKPSGGPAPGGPGGQPIVFNPPQNPYVPGGSPAPGNGLVTLPTRTLRTTPSAAAPSPYGGGYGGQVPGSTTSAGGVSLPGFSFGTPQQNTTTTVVAPPSNLTPEEHEILTEVNYQKAVNDGNPSAALFPPTRLNPSRNVASTPNPNAVPDAQLPAQVAPRRVRVQGP